MLHIIEQLQKWCGIDVSRGALLMRTAVTLAAMTLGNAALSADGNQCALVGFYNSTTATVTYQFKWGEGAWHSYVLAPGASLWHSWKYETIDQDHSPVPFIHFRQNLNTSSTHQLEAYAAPFGAHFLGKRYLLEADQTGLNLSESN